jgi:hypothetical protein
MLKTKSWRRRVGLAGVLLLISTGLPRAQDTVAGTLAACTDKKPSFDASGTLTTTDATNNGVNGPSYLVRDVAAPFYWHFNIKHKTTAPHWNAAGAVGVQVCMDGSHNDGPHDNDVDPNALDEIASKPLPVGFGVAGAFKVSKYGKKEHPAGADGNHFDHYGFKAVLTALAGGGNQLTGAYEVHARHEKTSGRPTCFDGYALGTSPSQGTYVFYDAVRQLLSVSIGGIDILDEHGGQSGGISPPYAGDPVTSGQMLVTDLPFLGWEGEGYVFGGGQIVVTDPRDNFDVEGHFSRYVIESTLAPPVASFGLLDELDVRDVASEAAGPSRFLEDFANGNMLWEADSTRVTGGIALGISTPEDLVSATNSFTQSAQLPAWVIVALLRDDTDLVGVGEAGIAPPTFGLQASPNPAAAGANIRFTLPADGLFTLRIFDAAGRLMRSTSSAQGFPGRNVWFWDGRDARGRAVAGGAYFYELSAGGRTERRKLIILQ